MKKYVLPAVIMTVAAVLFVTAPAYSSEEQVVAKVGDRSITESELNEALKKIKPPSSYHTVNPESMSKFRKDALKELIEIELLHKEAMKRDFKVSEQAVDEVVKANRERFGSEERMNDALEKKGISLNDFKDEIRKHQRVFALLNDLQKEAEYGDEELRRHYEENKSRFKRPESVHFYHIMVKVAPEAVQEEREEKRLYTEEILEKIKSGEDFGNIAYNYSEDAYKFKSGDYGFVHKGQLEKSVEDAAFSLKEGELSGVIQSIYGFHIIKGGERKEQEIMSFDEVREKTKKELDEQRFEENKKALLDRLREEFPVEIYLNTDD